MPRSITLVNMDMQSDGSIVPNASATAGTVYALVQLDDAAATAEFNKGKLAGKIDLSVLNKSWDLKMLGQAAQTVSVALQKLTAPTADELAQRAAQEKANADAQAALVSSVVLADQVP